MPNDSQPTDVIRRLLAEARALPKRKLPSTLAKLLSRPLMPGYQPKSPGEYDQDNRRRYLLQGLSDAYGEHVTGNLADLNGGRDLAAQVNDYRRGGTDRNGNPTGKDALDSPYYWAGVLGSGSVLSNVGQWYTAMPATAYNASRVLGDAIAPGSQGRNPRRDLDRSVNTLLFEAPMQYGWVPRDTGTFVDDNEEARLGRGEVPFHQMDRHGLYEKLDQAATNKIRASLPSGEKFLGDQGLPPAVATWGGLLMDSTLDPLNGLLAAAKLARVGQGWKAAGVMASDYGIPAALTAAPSVLDTLTPPPDVRRGYR